MYLKHIVKEPSSNIVFKAFVERSLYLPASGAGCLLRFQCLVYGLNSILPSHTSFLFIDKLKPNMERNSEEEREVETLLHARELTEGYVASV